MLVIPKLERLKQENNGLRLIWAWCYVSVISATVREEVGSQSETSLE
jgi:hypothetical protein